MRQTRKAPTKFNKFIIIGLLHITFFVIFTEKTSAQSNGSTPLALAQGHAAGSYQLSDVENLNYFNGRLNISIPLANPQGRGESSYPLSASINSPSWYTEQITVQSNTGEYVQAPYIFNQPRIGSVTDLPRIDIRMTTNYTDTTTCYGSPFRTGTLTRIYATMADGTEYEFRDTLTDGQELGMTLGTGCFYYPNRGRVFVTKDGSNMMFVADNDVHDDGITGGVSGYLILGNGTTLRTGLVDRNGNSISFSGSIENGLPVRHITDSLRRDTSFQPIFAYDAALTSSFVKYKGVGGQQERQLSIVGSMLSSALANGETIKKKKDLFREMAYDGTNNWEFDIPVISSIALPNGLSYDFKYNSYGDLVRIKFPTGAVVEYTWANGVDGAAASGILDIGNDTFIYRRVIERRVYDDGINLTSKTTISRPESVYGYGIADVGYIDIKTYTPQLAGFERHYFYGQATSTFSGVNSGVYSSWKVGREYKTEVRSPQDSGLLRRTEQQWQQNSPSWWGNLPSDDAPTNNPYIAQTTITLGDSNQVTKKTFLYDNFNNLTDTYEYDYGTGAPGQFMRRSHTDYLTTNPVNNIDYTSNNIHILNLPSQTWISSDAAGNNKVSLTKFEYDNYTTDSNHASLMSRSNVSGHDTTNFGTVYTSRGNLTQVISYTDVANQTGAVTISTQYDVLGNAVKKIDAKGNATTLNYNDNFGAPDNEARTNTSPSQLNGLGTFAFATSATSALGFTSYTQFDYSTGLTVNTEDINGAVSKIIYNDLLDRPTQFVQAAGTSQEIQTTTFYDDANRKIQQTSDLNNLNDNLLKTESIYDKMGRTVESRTYEANGNYKVVQTQYDALGRAYKVSNPYRPTEINANNPIFWTIKRFDALGRITELETPDAAKVLSSYSGNATTITDQAGKSRRSITNAVGQLIRMDEPNSNGQLGAIDNPNQPTSYNYDALNNLTIVTQGVQTRTFIYDSLSRLKSVTNPESGAIQYTYDLNGNLQTKRDARGIKAIYDYDNLNRLVKRCYRSIGTGSLGATNCASAGSETAEPNTLDVTYGYDDSVIAFSKGKLTKLTTGNVLSPFSVTENTEFDILGRVKKNKQTTDGNAYNEMTYTYNLAGILIEQKYPSGRIVKNVLDNNGELSIVQSKDNTNQGFWNYASHFTYTAAGAVSSVQLGNGHWESTQFNNRLQPVQIALGLTPNTTNLLKLDYEYGALNVGTGQVTAGTNNGNAAKQTITVPTAGSSQSFTATQYYTYDSLNRLQIASENLTPNGQATYNSWKQTFTYDRYGNRNFDEANTTTLLKNCTENNIAAVCAGDRPVVNPSVNTSNNRLNNYQFDDAGNTTKDAQGRKFTYDGENKQVKAETVDANGNVTGTIGQYYYDGDGKRVKKYVPSTGETTIFVYDASGDLIAEYSTITAPPSEVKVSYLTSDNLGSPRINTDANGTVVSRHDYQPFGEEISRTGYGNDNVRKKFTGYEKDNETDLDFAQARYYNNRHGRFTVPDPLLTSGRPTSPQTWNRFAYVLNNPLTQIDPDGLYECKGTADECKSFREDLAAAKAKLADIETKYTKNSKEYEKAEKALNAYGCESKGGNCVDEKGNTITEKNAKTGKMEAVKDTASNVQVSFNYTGGVANTNLPDTQAGKIFVRFAKGQSSNFGLIANEGINVADMQSGLKTGKSVSKYQSEFDGLFVQAVFGELRASANNKASAYFAAGAGGQVNYWEKGWETADHAKLRTNRDAAINSVLKGAPYNLTPNSKTPLMTFPKNYKPKK